MPYRPSPRRVLSGAFLGAFLCGASAARAESPLVTPLADVDVIYRVNVPGGSALHQRMRWHAADWRQRLDFDGGESYMLSDYRARTMLMVDPAHHHATTQAAPASSFLPPGTPAQGRWRRLGAPLQIAGESCVPWEGTDTDNRAAILCYTPDGLLLAARSGGVDMLMAEHVARQPQPAALFEVPPGTSVETPPPQSQPQSTPQPPSSGR